jgi:hypothetical protein
MQALYVKGVSVAFDMYVDQISEKIEHNEEYIFSYINEDDTYPLLNWIWNEYYKSPRINSAQSNGIVHELISLCATHKSNKKLVNTINRLLPFFSYCYKNELTIKSASD